MTAVTGVTGGRAPRGDRGAATVLVLAVAAMLLLATAALLAWSGALVLRQRAEGVADLAALAGARHVLRGEDGCAAAARIATAGTAELVGCAVGPRGDVTVVVELDPAALRRLPWLRDLDLPPARARARAGGSP